MRSTLPGLRPGAARIALYLAAGSCLWAGLLALSGCTSDVPSAVGTGLADMTIDVALQPLAADSLQAFGPLEITDPDVPLNSQQVLYLGSQEGASSSILVNFDFDNVFTEEYPQTMFTAARIKTVKFSLTKLAFYGAPDTLGTEGAAKALELYYQILHLDAPFDSTAYPGPQPSGQPVERVFPNLTYGNEPRIQIFEQDFLGWLASGGTHGFMIDLDERSEPGLVGFGSRELKAFNQLDNIAVGTVVAPNFIVEFETGEVNYLLAPVADVSTFHEVPPAPVDPSGGFIMRTGLRSYPAFRFDFSGLPQNAFINRAVFAVTNDTTTSFGNLLSVVVSELDLSFFSAPYGPLELDTLGESVYVITGRTSVDPVYHRYLRFDVTQAVQRIVNGVYQGQRGLVLTAGEDFAPLYDLSTLDPEFYYSQLNFLGTSAPDSLRPRLEITYSLSNELGEGGR